MKRSWFSLLVVVVLLGSLGVLAALQYRWLGQISDGQRESLQKRLQTDTERFAEDFNAEIRKAYLNFQFDAAVWKTKNWQPFNEQLENWKKNSPYPAMISGFYFAGNDGETLAYSEEAKAFVPAALPPELSHVGDGLKTDVAFEPVIENIPALIVPVYEELESLTMQRVKVSVDMPIRHSRPKFGAFVIRLDKNVIETQVFPALTQQYFSGIDNANYRLAIVSRADMARTIFTNHPGEAVTAADSSSSLLSISPEKMAFFLRPEMVDKLKRREGEPKQQQQQQNNVVINQRFESSVSASGSGTISPPPANKPPLHVGQERTFTFEMKNEEKPRVTVMESHTLSDEGAWVLNVQHRDGSLEQFIGNTRNRNLAISFGILGLLGVSVALIFLSAQRARMLAQRQLDFVSSVSHEFRTPLAVIYTAGENLTDGVVDSRQQVSEYGTLIKREGKKLSSMVEQILEFAGARSGKRKYDLRPVSIENVLSSAIAECQPLINESGFTVEKNVQSGLPDITADGNALSHAFQNLINNAIKYSREDKRLKITAENGGGAIKLSFEDHGRGISSRERSQIFEPFYRGKEVVEAQIHGNGLGLSLVKQIVEAHNGRIDVESRPGEGSKFTLTLPL